MSRCISSILERTSYMNYEIIIVENNSETKEIFADEEDGTFGVFVFIGLAPKSEIFNGMIDMENGYIVTNEDMQTNIPGVYAVGDIRKKGFRQVVTACADGAIAAQNASYYIK